MNTDPSILSLVKEGSVRGHKLLFDKYYKRLYLQACLMVQHEGEAEDIVQEVFIYLWQNNKFDTITSSLNAYLSSCVRNACFNHIKKKQAIQPDRLQVPDDEYSVSEYLLREDAAELDRRYNQMKNAIEQLPPKCKQVFTMVYLERKKYEETAKMLNLSINTVKTQLRVAFEKIKQMIVKNCVKT
jgi:RNA polymerase sigma-70 factor (ECF subfamily)